MERSRSRVQVPSRPRRALIFVGVFLSRTNDNGLCSYVPREAARRGALVCQSMGDNIFLFVAGGAAGILIALNLRTAWALAMLFGLPAIFAFITTWTDRKTSFCKLTGGDPADCIDEAWNQVLAVGFGLVVGGGLTLAHKERASSKGP
jgi:hypothetical protein